MAVRPTRRMLDIVLARTGMSRAAEEIFEDWTNLREVSRRFCWWVSPYVELEDGNVADLGIVGAIEAFVAAEKHGPRAQMNGFLKALIEVAPALSRVRLSVRASDGQWLIWQCDQPLCECLVRNGRESVQIRVREVPLQPEPLAIKLASYICRFQDLQLANWSPICGNGARE